MTEKKGGWLAYGIIIVAALGYFVDIYDLILFNVVKKESLEAIMSGATEEVRNNTALFLFNMQMTGMLLGGIIWGIWGDKKGRQVLLVLYFFTARQTWPMLCKGHKYLCFYPPYCRYWFSRRVRCRHYACN